jgi:hypothetical protein
MPSRVVRLCRQDESSDRFTQIRSSAGLHDSLLAQVRAALLVIGGMGVVNGIMKPDGQLHSYGVFGQLACRIEFDEALAKVPEVVVVPLRLGNSARPTPGKPLVGRLRW